MKTTIPIDDVKRRTLRIPVPLYGKLKDAALADKRSINAEVLWILEVYLGWRLFHQPKPSIISWLPGLADEPTASELTREMLER